MLLELAIAQMCVGLPNVDYQACVKTLDAASIQCSVKQDFEAAEHGTYELVYKKASSITGERALGVAAFVVKVVRDRSARIPILRNPNGIIPSILSTVNQRSGTIELNWRF